VPKRGAQRFDMGEVMRMLKKDVSNIPEESLVRYGVEDIKRQP
jgi:hypothetical protein